MTGASAPGSRPVLFRRRQIDWYRAAELLAQGSTLIAAADQVGCSRSQLSRRRNHDPVFQRWMEECEASSKARINALRPGLVKAIENAVGNSNVRVVLWLADRLKLVTPPKARTPEQELTALLGSLTQDELQEFQALRDPPTE